MSKKSIHDTFRKCFQLILEENDFFTFDFLLKQYEPLYPALIRDLLEYNEESLWESSQLPQALDTLPPRVLRELYFWILSIDQTRFPSSFYFSLFEEKESKRKQLQEIVTKALSQDTQTKTLLFIQDVVQNQWNPNTTKEEKEKERNFLSIDQKRDIFIRLVQSSLITLEEFEKIQAIRVQTLIKLQRESEPQEFEEKMEEEDYEKQVQQWVAFFQEESKFLYFHPTASQIEKAVRLEDSEQMGPSLVLRLFKELQSIGKSHIQLFEESELNLFLEYKQTHITEESRLSTKLCKLDGSFVQGKEMCQYLEVNTFPNSNSNSFESLLFPECSFKQSFLDSLVFRKEESIKLIEMQKAPTWKGNMQSKTFWALSKTIREREAQSTKKWYSQKSIFSSFLSLFRSGSGSGGSSILWLDETWFQSISMLEKILCLYTIYSIDPDNADMQISSLDEFQNEMNNIKLVILLKMPFWDKIELLNKAIQMIQPLPVVPSKAIVSMRSSSRLIKILTVSALLFGSLTPLSASSSSSSSSSEVDTITSQNQVAASALRNVPINPAEVPSSVPNININMEIQASGSGSGIHLKFIQTQTLGMELFQDNLFSVVINQLKNEKQVLLITNNNKKAVQSKMIESISILQTIYQLNLSAPQILSILQQLAKDLVDVLEFENAEMKLFDPKSTGDLLGEIHTSLLSFQAKFKQGLSLNPKLNIELNQVWFDLSSFIQEKIIENENLITGLFNGVSRYWSGNKKLLFQAVTKTFENFSLDYLAQTNMDHDIQYVVQKLDPKHVFDENDPETKILKAEVKQLVIQAKNMLNDFQKSIHQNPSVGVFFQQEDLQKIKKWKEDAYKYIGDNFPLLIATKADDQVKKFISEEINRICAQLIDIEKIPLDDLLKEEAFDLTKIPTDVVKDAEDWNGKFEDLKKEIVAFSSETDKQTNSKKIPNDVLTTLNQTLVELLGKKTTLYNEKSKIQGKILNLMIQDQEEKKSNIDNLSKDLKEAKTAKTKSQEDIDKLQEELDKNKKELAKLENEKKNEPKQTGESKTTDRITILTNIIEKDESKLKSLKNVLLQNSNAYSAIAFELAGVKSKLKESQDKEIQNTKNNEQAKYHKIYMMLITGLAVLLSGGGFALFLKADCDREKNLKKWKENQDQEE